MIRVALPQHLQTLARVGSEVEVDVPGPATLRGVLDALEARYPVLRGTIRDQSTFKRRAFVLGPDLRSARPRLERASRKATRQSSTTDGSFSTIP